MRLSGLLLAASLVAACSGSVAGSGQAAAQTRTLPPAFVTETICRPAFTVDGERLEAGTAFVLKSPGPDGKILLVTAQHLFGPSGGLDADIAWDAMPANVSAVTCEPLESEGPWKGGKAFAIPGAHGMSDVMALKDIAAFPLRWERASAVPRPLVLASKMPAAGERVWLVAQVIEGAPPSQLLHPGKPVYDGRGLLQFVYDNPGLVLRATSGAPVVNAAGELVGINLGGGRDRKTGELVGTAEDISVVRAALGGLKTD